MFKADSKCYTARKNEYKVISSSAYFYKNRHSLLWTLTVKGISAIMNHKKKHGFWHCFQNHSKKIIILGGEKYPKKSLQRRRGQLF